MRTIVLWAQLLVDGAPSNPDHALGAPDGQTVTLAASYGIALGDFAADADGPSGDLARLLRLHPRDLPVGAVVAFEDNGGHAAAARGWESSVWTFSDGVDSVTVAFDETEAELPAGVVATGSVSAAAYAAHFDLDPDLLGGPVYSFLVFDLGDTVDVLSPDLTIAVEGGTDLGGEGTPDPDAVGIVVGWRASPR